MGRGRGWRGGGREGRDGGGGTGGLEAPLCEILNTPLIINYNLPGAYRVRLNLCAMLHPFVLLSCVIKSCSQ